MKSKRAIVRVSAKPVCKPQALLTEVRELILNARQDVARAVDSALTTLYSHVGQRIRQDILKEKRAGYGEQIVSALGRQFSAGFGRGYSERAALPRKGVFRTPGVPGGFQGFGFQGLSLAKGGNTARLQWNEVDRNHTALASVERRGAAADLLGAHPAAGGFVHGVRAGTG